MLRQVAEGVFVHSSEWVATNAVVVESDTGVLLVDPGIHRDELECLARDVGLSGLTIAAGFSTHPHWDHLLWHLPLGSPPRYATALCAATARERLAGGIDAQRYGIPEDAPLDLLGDLTPLPAGSVHLPWDGLVARIIEHRAHAPGHAALLIESRGVLIAGDMLSDVLIPMLDFGAVDPVGDYLAALRLLEAVADDVDVVIPGHGSVGDDVRARIDLDRAYVEALRDGGEPDDPRVGSTAKPGWEWVSDVHEGQLARLAQLRT